MSFVYKGDVINLSNYSEVFGNIDMDFLDEIRLAILDDTPIGGYLETAFNRSDGAYKLSQIRKALRDFVPAQYITFTVSPDVLRGIRRLHTLYKPEYLDKLSPYISKQGVSLPNDALLALITAIEHGAAVEKVNFKRVNSKNVLLVIAALEKNYPIELIAECNMTPDYMQLLVRAMSVGLDVHPFIDTVWNKDCLTALIKHGNEPFISDLIGLVNEKFSYAMLDRILAGAVMGVDYARLCLKDEQGYPLYNEHQASVLLTAMYSLDATEDMFDFTLSDMTMQEMRDRNRANRYA